jgi:hypothetical protein
MAARIAPFGVSNSQRFLVEHHQKPPKQNIGRFMGIGDGRKTNLARAAGIAEHAQNHSGLGGVIVMQAMFIKVKRELLDNTYLRATLLRVEVMMKTQNITLSLPKDVLLKVKLIAVKRQTSVSSLLTQTLENLVRQEEAYAHSRLRHLQWLEQGIDLGTGGQITTTRDELHERR